jgi:DNA-binding NtrC family response regulator
MGEDNMTDTDVLKGKKILIVDDEPDVLDVLEDLLDMCEIQRAGNFEDAKEFLELQAFDVAILDIMGVNGYGLLEIAKKQNIPALMLTAHAFTPEHLTRSVKDGAASYIPKEKIADIADFIIDILKANQEGKSSWEQWQARFPQSYFEKTWGATWKDASEDFKNTLRAAIVAKNKTKK